MIFIQKKYMEFYARNELYVFLYSLVSVFAYISNWIYPSNGISSYTSVDVVKLPVSCVTWHIIGPDH